MATDLHSFGLPRQWAARGAIAACCAVGVASGAVDRRSAAQAIDAIAVAQDHVLVKLAADAEWIAPRAKDGVWTLTHASDAARTVFDWAQVGTPEPLFRQGAGHDEASAVVAQDIGLDRWYRLPINNGDDSRFVAQLIAAVCDDCEVVEVDGIGGVATNDPAWPQQWAMLNDGSSGGTAGADISAPGAWAVAPRQGNAVIVGVLDAGVAPHADLEGRILPGFNVPNQNTNTADVCGYHGTHVCGTIAARADNAVAMAGLASQALILPVVVVNPCSGSEAWVAEGLVWAVDHGADLINMSLQYSVGSQALHDAVLYAAALDIPMVAATGNSALSQPAFPARWPETIAVTATDKWDSVWALSNIGMEVDVAAPGVAVDSLYGTTGVSSRTGTSMAAPHVSGTIALIMAEVPSLSSALIRVAIEGTADDIDIAGFDIRSGHGRLNAAGALAAAIALGPGPGDLNGDGQVSGADLAIVLGAWGPCACPCAADTNGDCDVDGSDLAAVLSGWSGD